MALTAREFLEECERNPPELALQAELRQREAEGDAYYEKLGKLVEAHPIINPQLVLERRARSVG